MRGWEAVDELVDLEVNEPEVKCEWRAIKYSGPAEKVKEPEGNEYSGPAPCEGPRGSLSE